MKIITRFDLGMTVFPIRQRHETIGDPCPDCDGTGRAALAKGGSVRCPSNKCFNGKVNRQEIHPWTVVHESVGRIGNIRVSLYDPDEYEQHESERQYMLDSTGIGSGALWGESQLFPTAEAAQAACDKRNAVKP